jgi:hypothetical protein
MYKSDTKAMYSSICRDRKLYCDAEKKEDKFINILMKIFIGYLVKKEKKRKEAYKWRVYNYNTAW